MSHKATSGAAKATRSHSRLSAVLDAGAKLFAVKGYKATTMRDIASEAGMLPGSLYYHFESKQQLLLAIYRQAVTDIRNRLDTVSTEADDPWQQLETAVVGHIGAIVDQTNYAKVMIGVLPDDAPEIKRELTALRDDYERRFGALIDELPLPGHIDRKLLRLLLLGAINATQTWYKPGTYTPEQIGHSMVSLLRQPLG